TAVSTPPKLFFCRDLLAQVPLLFSQLRSEIFAEIGSLEDLANFDLFASVKRSLLEPLHRVLHGIHSPEPKACDQLLRLSEWAVGDHSVISRELDALAFGARLEAFSSEHYAGFDQLLVIFPHFG